MFIRSAIGLGWRSLFSYIVLRSLLFSGGVSGARHGGSLILGRFSCWLHPSILTDEGFFYGWLPFPALEGLAIGRL